MNRNIKPYFDDFDRKKNYHQLLFKPGARVQARELNQIQSTSQNQLSSFADHIFEHGSVVEGGEQVYDTNVFFGKINPSYNGQEVDIESFVGKYAFFNRTVANNSIEHCALIKKAYRATGNNDPVLVFATISGNDFIPDVANTVFSVRSEYANLNSTFASFTASTQANNLGKTAIYSVNEGVFYVNIHDRYVELTQTKETKQGFFVYWEGGSVVHNPYTANSSYTVGFNIKEEIITSSIDSTLLDNSQGYSAFGTPGADRYKIYLELTTRELGTETSEKFISIADIKDGKLIRQIKYPIYSDIMETLQRRTYDESGDYLVRPFVLRLFDTAANNAVAVAEISAGKAYVKGAEIQFIERTGVNLDKSRDTESVTGFDIQTYYGSYFEANNISGQIPNINTPIQVEFHSNTSTFSNSTILGTAFIKNIDYASGSNGNVRFNIFTFNNTLIGNNNLENTRAIVIPTTANNYSSLRFSAVISNNSISNNKMFISDTEYTSTVFEIPQDFIANVSSISYKTKRVFTDVVFSNGQATISTLGSNERFVGASGNNVPTNIVRELYHVVSKTTGGSFTAGEFIPLDTDSRTVNIPVVSNTSLGVATINLNRPGFNGSADVMATIDVTDDARKVKTLVSNFVFSTSNVNSNATISLLKSDMYRLNAVYSLGNTSYSGIWDANTSYGANTHVLLANSSVMYRSNNSSTGQNPTSGNTNFWVEANNVTDWFVANTGMRDCSYDHASIHNTGNNIVGNVIAVFDYFTHGGGRGYFDVKSYPIPYENIPSYTSPRTGKKFELRDCLDFRPRRQDDSANVVYGVNQLPLQFTSVDGDYSYYLRRVDKLMLDNKGRFIVSRGKSSYISPPIPAERDDALTLFTLYYPPYTLSASDITIIPNNVRRYTMKDIGTLDRRLSAVEYYTALSLLEKEVEAKKIYGDNNLEMFKNGFLVDSFAGHSVGNVDNPDYKCSIDFVEQYLRPPFSAESYNFDYVSANTSGFSVRNNVLTLPYTEVAFAEQKLASKTVRLNPFASIAFRGKLVLSPDNDVWKDTQRRPDVLINEEGANDAWAGHETPWQTEWNEWQTTWSGRDKVETRTGVQVRPATTIVKSRSSNIVDTSLVPYARSREIYFEASGLKPSTIHYLSINLFDITPFVRPFNPATGQYNLMPYVTANGVANTSSFQFATSFTPTSFVTKMGTHDTISRIIYADVSTPANTISPENIPGNRTTGTTLLRSDANGTLKGYFKLPSDNDYVRFPSGNLRVILTDMTSNFFESSSSFAEATFYSSGSIDFVQDTITSLRLPKIYGQSLSETKVTPGVNTSSGASDYGWSVGGGSTGDFGSETGPGGFGFGDGGGTFGGGAGGGGDGGGGCFIGDALVHLNKTEKKKISEIKVGDLVLSADGSTYNKVLFVEKMISNFKTLYSLDDGIEPFITEQHPIIINKELFAYNENVYPWLNVKKIKNVLTRELKDGEFVYNLWVDGDHTFIVNDVNVIDIMDGGGFILNALNDKIINENEFYKILYNFGNSSKISKAGSHVLNNIVGKLNNKALNTYLAEVLLGKRNDFFVKTSIFVVGVPIVSRYYANKLLNMFKKK